MFALPALRPPRPPHLAGAAFTALATLVLGTFAPAAAAPTAAAPTAQGAPAARTPFAMNGWQLHDYNMPKLEEAVRRARGYGVNFLVFSHEMFRSVEGFLASDDKAQAGKLPEWARQLKRGEHFRVIPGWQTDLRRLGDLANQQGIPYYMWVHEFDDVPHRFLVDGRVNMEDPQLWAYLTERYERLLRAVPGTAGFVLTLHESDLKVFRHGDVVSRDDVAGRVYKVSKLLHDVLRRHGKQLIVRNFFYEPLEMDYFKRGVDRLPDDVIVMSKDTTHEFHPYYPWDPLHGQFGKKRQIIEIDLGVEKAWDWRGAYAQTDYVRRVALRARDTRQAGLVGRARLFWERPFHDMHEINLYAFARFLANPTLSVDQVLSDWAGARFPARAVPYIVSALKRSETINHRGRWHLEYWFTKEIGREWADYGYIYSRVLQRSRFKWTRDEADRKLEEKLYRPDEETFRRVIAEKDEVVAEVRAARADLRQASRWLTAAQIAPLEEDFRFLQDAALLQREWVRAYFAQRLYVDRPSPAHKRTFEEAVEKLELYERTPGVTYGLNVETGRRYNIDGFIRELRRRVADPAAAQKEDARVLALTKAAADVANR